MQKLDFKHRLGNTIMAIIGIVEYLVMIITFSSIMPRWTMKWIIFRMHKGRRWFWGKSN